MRNIISSLESEFRKYKRLGEIAFGQLTEGDLAQSPGQGCNSVASLVWHLSGNFKSRFTDFLTTDGEKPWRNRADEFSDRAVTHADLLQRWNEGWHTLFRSLEILSDSDLDKTVSIDSKSHRVDQALHRSLAHTSYHVGQIVFFAKAARGSEWKESKSFTKAE